MHAGQTNDGFDQRTGPEFRFWGVKVDPGDLPTPFGRVGEDCEIVKDDSIRRRSGLRILRFKLCSNLKVSILDVFPRSSVEHEDRFGEAVEIVNDSIHLGSLMSFWLIQILVEPSVPRNINKLQYMYFTNIA